METTSLCPISYLIWRLSDTTYHTSVGFSMLLIVENQKNVITRGIGCPDFANNPSEASLNSHFFLVSS